MLRLPTENTSDREEKIMAKLSDICELVNQKIKINVAINNNLCNKYISTENRKFQPMNANFGILPELETKIKDKKLKYEKLADRALSALKNKNM